MEVQLHKSWKIMRLAVGKPQKLHDGGHPKERLKSVFTVRPTAALAHRVKQINFCFSLIWFGTKNPQKSHFSCGARSSKIKKLKSNETTDSFHFLFRHFFGFLDYFWIFFAFFGPFLVHFWIISLSLQVLPLLSLFWRLLEPFLNRF